MNIVLITGASRGIGREIAKNLAKTVLLIQFANKSSHTDPQRPINTLKISINNCFSGFPLPSKVNPDW